MALYTLNKSKRWWDDTNAEFPELRDELISEILRKNPFPVLDGKTATLDGIVCGIVESESTKQESWLEIRGFRGSPIYIPVEKTSFYSDTMSEGKECSVTQIHLDRDGKLGIHRVVQKDNAPLRQEGKDIGIDWGLTSLVATSEGQLLGLSLYLSLIHI